jgi:hypothetical protein
MSISEDRLPIRVVCATRKSKEQFFLETQTGKSIRALINISRIDLRLFPENSRGLGEVYNEAIAEAATDPAILVFMHDDVLIADFYWTKRVVEGLMKFDVVGVAGNARRVPMQPTWAHLPPSFQWDDKANLSGIVAHGNEYPPAQPILPYGPPWRECKLLDGVLLAAASPVLTASDLRFDPSFKFHFYDLDFCRQAESRGLSMGTIPLGLMHASGGNFGTPEWLSAYQQYIDKWKE